MTSTFVACARAAIVRLCLCNDATKPTGGVHATDGGRSIEQKLCSKSTMHCCFEITAEEIITPLIKENATARKAVAFMVAGGGFEPQPSIYNT